VRINQQTLQALGRHLDGEIDCLETLCELLDRETRALREMDLCALDEISPLKESLLNRQMILARARLSLLSNHSEHNAPPRFTDIIAECDLSADDPFTRKVERLRALANQIQVQNQLNREFAKSGHGLVSALVQIVDVFRSPQAQTYASNGHIRRSVMDQVPRGVQPCSA